MTTKNCFASIASHVASIYVISASFVASNFFLLYLIYPPQNLNHFDYLYIIHFDSKIKSPTTNTSILPVLDTNPSKVPPPDVANMTVVVGDVNTTLIVHSIEEDEDEDESAMSYPLTNFTNEERMEWIKEMLPKSKLLESTWVTRKFEQKIEEFVSAKKCSVSIYMTWIYTTRLMGKRELFSLESILKASPGACVMMISRIMSSKRGKEIIQPLVERGHKVHPIAPDFNILFSGTPAQEWLEKLRNGKMDPGDISITQNLSNIFRLVLLYKYGGIYLDTDMIILRDLTVLRNIIGIQAYHWKSIEWKTVNNAVLIFDKYHPLLLRFMEEFATTFNGSDWGYNGPHMATRVINKLRKHSNYQFNLMSNMAFYPIQWDNIYRFYRDPYLYNDTK